MAEPDKREEWREWLDEFQGESDRACALLGAAFLDEQLRALHESFLVDDKRVQELFESPNGPLGSLSSKIDMAFALGFLAPTEVHDLHLIRKIRNDFAHKLHGITFSSGQVASRCAELKYCDSVGGRLGTLNARSRFTLSAALLANRIALRRLGIGSQRRKICPEVKWNK